MLRYACQVVCYCWQYKLLALEALCVWLQLITTPCLTAAAEQGKDTALHSKLHTTLLCRREWCNTARRLQNQQHAAESAISLPDPALRCTLSFRALLHALFMLLSLQILQEGL